MAATDYLRLAAAITRAHLEVLGLRPEPAPEPQRCAYCSVDPVDEGRYPYCSAQCAISAEADR